MLVCPLCRLTLSDNENTCPRDGNEGVQARQHVVPSSIRARFSIVEAFGQGDSGELYLSDDTQTGRRGLLKLLRLPKGATPAEKARLKRELVKQATLEHPVLSVPLATGDADGRPWIFREWHEGVSLRVKLARGGAMAVPEAISIAAQIAAALDELHRAGLLHRDLCPGHVILMPQPSGLSRAAVIDAGIGARIETDAVFDVTGTPAYISPEQAKGKLVSFRSDLYALGCVMYEMLTGAPPFSGTTEELLSAHATQPAPTPQLDVPSGVSTLLSQLLAKEPRDRPFSAQQVRRALTPFLPEDASSQRESTQTFEHLTDRRRVVPTAGSGTLRPPGSAQAAASAPTRRSVPPPSPPRKGTPTLRSDPPPPPTQGRPARRGANTLLGAGPPKSADATQELSPLDLHEADAVLPPSAAPKVARTLLGMPARSGSTSLAELDAGLVEARPSAKMATSPGFAPAVPPPGPPTTSARGSSAQGSSAQGSSAQGSSSGVSGTAATMEAPLSSPGGDALPVVDSRAKPLTPTAAPPWSVADPAGLDYDDLAETYAFDRESNKGSDPYAQVAAPSAPSSYAAVSSATATSVADAVSASGVVSSSGAVSSAGAAAAHTAPATSAPSATRVAPQKKAMSVLPFLAVFAVMGLCLMLSVVGIAVVLMVSPGRDESQVAAAPPATWEAPFPSAPPTPQPVVAVEPTPVEPSAVAPAPVEAAPVEAAPIEAAPIEAAPVERPPVERPPVERVDEARAVAVAERPAPRERAVREPPREPASGLSRLQQFQQAREEALAHFRARRFGPAAAAYERATRLNPRHAGSFAGLGAARLADGRNQQAVQAYQRATALQPGHSGFQAALGRAHQAAGDRGRARQAYQRALVLDPNNQSARQGLAAVGG